jgi:hypothetical protein
VLLAEWAVSVKLFWHLHFASSLNLTIAAIFF